MDAKEMKEYLFEDVSRIIEVLEYYNFHSFWNNSEELRCAKPEGTNKTSVSIQLSEDLYATCFSDNFNGDIYGLIQFFSGDSFIEVLKGINDLFGFSVGVYKANKKLDLLKELRTFKRKSEKSFENKKHDKGILDDYIKKPHASMLQECISPQVLDMFDIRFDVKRSRIVFPYFDETGEFVVGIQGRHTETAEVCKMLDIPKYWNYISKDFRKSNALYGWHLAKENVNTGKFLILVEGEKSVMKQTTFAYGVCNSVALGGHSLSDYQVKTIIRGTESDVEIIIALDNDISEEEVIEMGKRFSKYRKTTYIFDQYKILGEKASPFDKGFKKYDLLFRHRREIK